jgi:hypothetical protein
MEKKTPGKENEKPFSYLHPMATGGLIGGDGYSFQDRFIVCHIPIWLRDPSFVKLMNEGSGDVDLVYSNSGMTSYEHIQVKDHQVTPGEFKDIVKGFATIDSGLDKTFRKFTLASPSVSQQIKSFADGLDRYREAKKFFNDSDGKRALATTKKELEKKIRDLGLSEYSDFMVNKLSFDIGRFDFNNNDTCRQLFIASLSDHPEYKAHLLSIFNPVYSKLIEDVIAHRGKVIENSKLHESIRSALTTNPSPAEGTVIHVHNWSVEKFDPPPSFEIDWSSHFDRSSRRVPEKDTWNNQLIPQILETRKAIASSTSNRLIVFRGQCSLTTGFALGMAFPDVGNWIFELLQSKQTWRSDASRIPGYELKFEEVDPALHGINTKSNEIGVVFNITGQAFEDVMEYLKSTNIGIAKLILIRPSSSPGGFSIPSDSEAVTLASKSKDVIKAMVAKYKAPKTHLFYFGPLGLSIFLGQKLSSVGSIQLYEFQDPGYKLSAILKT